MGTNWDTRVATLSLSLYLASWPGGMALVDMATLFIGKGKQTCSVLYTPNIAQVYDLKNISPLHFLRSMALLY